MTRTRMLLFPAALALGTMTTTAARAGDELPDGFPITSTEHQPTPMGLGITTETVEAGEPGILFLNFDGAHLNSGCGNDSHNDCSQMSGTFGGEILPYPGDEGIRASIAQAVRSDAKDFGLTVTDTRPPDSEDYAMVMVGNSVLGGAMYHGFAGVAPSIDCGDSNPNETSFALANSYNGNGMAMVIHQEAAHTWGLEHVNEKSDNLYPTSGGVADPQYTDGCHKIVSDTMLNPSGGRCNNVHVMFCNSAWQNSYQEMLWLFGAPNPDTTAPGVVIEMPADGANLPHPADFDLVVTLSDNESPQVLDTQVLLDGSVAIDDEYTTATLSFPVQGGIDPGSHTFRVEIADEAGNTNFAEVSFTLGEDGGDSGGVDSSGDDGGSADGGDDGGSADGGSADGGDGGDGADGGGDDGGDDGAADGGGDGGDASEDEGGCGCTTSGNRAPLAMALAGLGLLGVRRRRRR